MLAKSRVHKQNGAAQGGEQRRFQFLKPITILWEEEEKGSNQMGHATLGFGAVAPGRRRGATAIMRGPGRRRGPVIPLGRLARIRVAVMPGGGVASPRALKGPGRRRGPSKALDRRVRIWLRRLQGGGEEPPHL